MMNDYYDDPMRVGEPEDGFNENMWVEQCAECNKHLYEGDAVYDFEELPFGTKTICEDCLNSMHKRIL
jgi:hypothetical protein